MKKVLVTGAGGFLGARVMEQWKGRYELCSFPKGFLNSADEAAVRQRILQERPQVILHAAALSDTGYCAQYPEQAYRANVQLPVWVAVAARDTGAKLLALSSDQVYAGTEQPGALPETLKLQHSNLYGRYKLEMEQRVQALCPEAVLLRASWMYDLPGYGLPIRGNLPLNLLQAAVHGRAVSFSRQDHRGVTYVRQVVECLDPAMELPGGVYNFGSSNACDMVETAEQFANAMGLSVEIDAAHWKRNLAMDGTKLAGYGIRLDTTQQGIRRCMEDYGLSAVL